MENLDTQLLLRAPSSFPPVSDLPIFENEHIVRLDTNRLITSVVALEILSLGDASNRVLKRPFALRHDVDLRLGVAFVFEKLNQFFDFHLLVLSLVVDLEQSEVAFGVRRRRFLCDKDPVGGDVCAIDQICNHVVLGGHRVGVHQSVLGPGKREAFPSVVLGDPVFATIR